MTDEELLAIAPPRFLKITEESGGTIKAVKWYQYHPVRVRPHETDPDTAYVDYELCMTPLPAA